MNQHIIERATISGPQHVPCRNMRHANTLFDQLKDHATTLNIQLNAYGKVVRTHTSEQSVHTPLQNMKLTKHI